MPFTHCAKCRELPKNCECPLGFTEKLMANSMHRDLAVCLCGNAVPSGTWVERSIGGLWDGESNTKRRFVLWSHPGQCLPCLIEEKRIAKSAARSIELGSALAIMGNPFWDIDKYTNKMAFVIVRLIKYLNPNSQCYWSYLGDVKPLAKPLELDMVYRVNQPLPSLPAMDYNPALDRPNGSPSDANGSWTRRVSRGQ